MTQSYQSRAESKESQNQKDDRELAGIRNDL
jgi:hypothetical protein